MACRRSAVRSRYAPPSVLERKHFQTFLSKPILNVAKSIHTFNESLSTDEGLIASSIATTHGEIRSNESP